jgi:carboxylesterase type B
LIQRERIFFRLFVVLAVAMASVSGQMSPFPVTVAFPHGGSLTGTTMNHVDTFLGVQYAEVGERFSRSKLLDLTGAAMTINATMFGPNCHQGYPGLPEFLHQPREESEECLYFNIWRPSNSSGLLSVMVWIHGGGFIIGSGADQVHHGANLAREQNVMVVTIDYRLGALGFLP